MIYAENEILGNIKCLLMPGCLLSISLLTPGLTVLLTTVPAPLLTAVTIVKFIFWPIGAVAIQERLQFKKKFRLKVTGPFV